MLFKKSAFSVILLFCLIHADLLAQNYLILQRGKNEKSRLTYEVGESIVYLQKGLDYYIEDVIREIKQGVIVLEENLLTLDQIEAIDVRDKDPRNQTLSNMSLLPIAAGGLLLFAGGVNSLYADQTISYEPEILVIAGSLIGGGLLLQPLRYRKFKNKGKNKLQVIALDELEEGKEQ
ncbi:hypothetical protein [Cyclobacterium plantarum]|uniref:hypothetical protein n=1 Tax=Cyclobacterium plantarum TaxID=2716263 RepID=UPI003F723398